MAIEVLEEYVENCDEQWEARDIFYADLDLDVPAMDGHFGETSEAAFLFWFAFDYQLDDGCYVVDRILKTNRVLSSGERRYLEQMRTSAGVKIEQYRADRPQQSDRREPEACLPRDSVYYLPGKIKISHMRKLQQVARGPSGRALMHRFMVRGHWRRPGANWKDQSLRWIEPYWRGPSLAGIIEREYRVFP